MKVTREQMARESLERIELLQEHTRAVDAAAYCISARDRHAYGWKPMRTSSGEEKHEQRHTRLPPLRVTLSAGLERSRTLHEVRVAMGFYAVPCNGCTLCCHGDAVRILPHEDARRWQTEPHPYMAGALMLAHKPNGDCVYLGDGGCTRQADKPQQCHEMDCRRIAQAVTKARAKKLDARGGMKIEIWRRGHELLRSNDQVQP